MDKLIAVLLGLLVVLACCLFTGWLVMLCWNATMPMIFGYLLLLIGKDTVLQS